jgi:hypothetical protein
VVIVAETAGRYIVLVPESRRWRKPLPMSRRRIKGHQSHARGLGRPCSVRVRAAADHPVSRIGPSFVEQIAGARSDLAGMLETPSEWPIHALTRRPLAR